MVNNKSYEPQTLYSTSTSRNAPPNNNGSNYLGQLNKHSHNISKPNSTQNLPLRIQPKNHAYNYNQMFTRLNPSLHPPVYKLSKSEFKDFVQKVTGCTPKITAPSPHMIKPKPQNMRLQSIRPPPMMPVPPPQLNTTFADHRNFMTNFNPMNPINNTINHVNPTNTINHSNPTNTNLMHPISYINNNNNNNNSNNNYNVAQTQHLPPLPSFSSDILGPESPITSYMRHHNDSLMSSSIPLLSSSNFYSPEVNNAGFQNLVPRPSWNNDVPI